MPVGARVFASHHPTGLKNRRSAHSSTTGPLLAYTRDSLFEHGLDRRQRFHRLLVGDDERRGDAHPRDLDHRGHPAPPPPGGKTRGGFFFVTPGASRPPPN